MKNSGVADSFEQILGRRRGKSTNLGPEMRSKRLLRLVEEAGQGETEKASNLLRREANISAKEKAMLKEAVISGLIVRSADELDLDHHWRRTLASTKLFKQETPYILSGPGKLLHLSLGDKEALCGAESNLFEAPRGRWSSGREGWNRCSDCLEQSEGLSGEAVLASQERPELVPLSRIDAEEIRDNLSRGLDLQRGRLTERAKAGLNEELCRCFTEKLIANSEEMLAIMQGQMLRTSQLEIRKRAWMLWGLRDWKELDEETWAEIARFMLGGRGARETLWGGLCHVMAQRHGRESIRRSAFRGLFTPLAIKASPAERADHKNLKREKQRRRRAGW